jgi:carbohydrate-selective porin OprB
LHREELTGDWGGTRGRWKEKGVELEFKLTQFYQGVAAGGLETGSEYNGKFETNFKFDFRKTLGLEFLVGTNKNRNEIRRSVSGGNGFDQSGQHRGGHTRARMAASFSITSFNVTKMWPIDLPKGELIAVSVGRFNTLDLVDEDFLPEPVQNAFFIHR